MDRTTIYPGQLPLEEHLLTAQQRTMVGLAKTAEALLGTTGAVDGFTCTPTSPTASLSIVLGAGTVYQSAQIEASAWSSLAVDTHNVIKQGIVLDPTVLTLVPPTTPGYAVNLLVQVRYQDDDDDEQVLPFYNAANPSVPLAGLSGNGDPLSTVRRGGVAIQVKYGPPTNAGLQITPNPDAGWLGIFVVTLAFGQTAISAAGIKRYDFAPFITAKLLDIPGAVQNGIWSYAIDSGTTGAAIVANLTPAPTNVGDNFRVSVKLAHDIQPDCTLNVSGFIGPVFRASGNSIISGDFRAGDIVDFVSNLGVYYITNTSSVLADIETPIVKKIGGTNPDFIDLNVAMAWLSRRRIRLAGTVTFQMAPGKFTYPTEINIAHQDGLRLIIQGAPLNGPLPAPSVLQNTGFGSAQRIADTAVNLASLRGVYTTEIAFTGGARMFVGSNIANIQDLLLTSDGTLSNDNLVLQYGQHKITRVWSVNAGGRGFATFQSYLFVVGNCGAMGCGMGMDSAGFTAVQPGAILAGMSCANVGLNGNIACADFNSAQLYARGNGVDGTKADSPGFGIVCSVITVSRDNGQSGYTAVNNGVINANGCSGSGSFYLFQAGQGGYIDASNGGGTPTSGSATSGFPFRAFIGGLINRFGTTCTGGASPAVGTIASDGAAVY